MIKFYKFGRRWGLADASPFCVKLENYFRLANIDFERQSFTLDVLRNAPKGKLPYIETENGFKIGDTRLIIEHLIENGSLDPDLTLSDEQCAISLAMQSMIEESLYWVGVYDRWGNDQNFSITFDAFFSRLPPIIRNIAANRQRKKMLKALYYQGYGRHDEGEIYDIGKRNVQALSDMLGDKDYFLGTDVPTMLDVTAHAFLVSLIVPPMESSFKEYARSCSNIMKFIARMDAHLYPQNK